VSAGPAETRANPCTLGQRRAEERGGAASAHAGERKLTAESGELSPPAGAGSRYYWSFGVQ